MKKYAVLGLASLFVLTGCGSKKVTCTQSINQAGVKADVKINIETKSDKVEGIDVEYKFSDKSVAKYMCSSVKGAKCDGKTVKISGDDALKAFGGSNIKYKGVEKDSFIKGIESTGFKCK